uniref:mobilization protein MbpC n=1 Tax=Bacteroides fragilis TaxID=817 RepID=UPI00356463D4
METNSRPEKEVSTSKQGQYRPRRKDTTPKVNPQLAVELVYQELKRVEAYTKRIEDATAQKVQIDGESLESAEKRLKNVLADFERQGNRMKSGGYVDKRVSFYSILCAVISFLFACLMCYLWTDAAKDRDDYRRYYEYYQEQAREHRDSGASK